MKIKLLNFIQHIITKYKYQLVLTLLILMLYYPLSMFIYIPKWDNMAAYLPYRYFISNYVWNGAMPLWNPFHIFGYPAYADLQSGAWYPLVWVLNLFGQYGITALIIELLSCFIIAGLGMYRLSMFLHKSPKTALILGLSYAASGFMTGSAQLMVFLVGVAWLPWCIDALLRFFTTFQYRYILYSALVVAMQISSASPAFTIILIYLYLLFFGYYFLINVRDLFTLKKVILGGLLLMLLLVALLLPYLYSYLDFSPYFNRATKLQYEGYLLANPFSFIYYISFVFPYTIISSSEAFASTDLSLRNGYFGIFMFVAFVIALIKGRKGNKYYWSLMGVIFFSLLLGLGDGTVVYKWFYQLPGFGVFRHPSIFRAYAILAMLLLGGFYLTEIIAKPHIQIKFRRVLLLTLLASLLAFMLVVYKSSWAEIVDNIHKIIQLQEFRDTGFYSHLAINLFIVCCLVVVFMVLTRYTSISVFKALLLVVFIDLAVQARLTAPTTIYYKFSYTEVNNFLNDLPNDINQTYNYTPFRKLNDKQGLKSTGGVWDNLGTFNKTLSRTGSNPMRFSSFDNIRKTRKYDCIIENPLMYFPCKLYSESDSVQPGLLWGVANEVSFDTVNTHLSNVVVDYNKFRAQVANNSETSQWLVLNQNYHHLWKANINGNPLEILKVNEMVMGVQIPAHTAGELAFTYKSGKLIYLFFISLLTYLIVIGFLVRMSLTKSKSS